MANRKLLPPEPRPPKIPGGRTRPSQRVRVTRYPAVAQRQALNARLLSATCAFSAIAHDPLRAKDTELLGRLLGERFSGEHALLRTQAVRELGRVQSLESIEHLAGIAMSPLEHDGLRAAAMAALASAAPRIARAVLASLDREQSRLVRQTAMELLTETGGVRPQKSGTRARRKRRTPARDGKTRL
jgi:hypothetical protein